ncbi:MAG: 50S ribosomal protein L24 [Candidatus ainarchaeum sp.]|nr:50S ribosomal protein L24 [Candidatus ainarchaeum sp.]
MKSDTERKKYYTEKLHKKKSRLHVHLSKELRTQLKMKKRAILVHKGDTVRIMRGPEKGKEAKVANVSTLNRKVFLEGVVANTMRGKEVPVALEPSNLLLIGLESTKERKEIFSDEAFRKREIAKPKAEAAKPTTPQAGAETKPTTTPKTSESAKPTTTPQASAATKPSEPSRSGAVASGGVGAAKADAKRLVQAKMPQTTQKIR